jgi:hypothetical protein
MPCTSVHVTDEETGANHAIWTEPFGAMLGSSKATWGQGNTIFLMQMKAPPEEESEILLYKRVCKAGSY